MQRLRDCKLSAGWTISCSPESIVISAISKPSIEVGDKLSLEIYGVQNSAFTYVEALSVAETSSGDFNITVRCVSGVRLTPTLEPARWKVQGTKAILSLEAVSSEAAVTDVSAGGIGLLTREPFAVGTKLDIEVITERSFMLSGTVRHCRPTNTENTFIVGMQVEPIGRISMASWRQMIDPLKKAKPAA
ncbi:MAG: PilZ domain-containing protein [Armatimonadetes bacterium]|nr:PilZ domain-containing protein [Armatimonadota bacterium]